MTTRAYVPNVDGEGSIGTTDKKWGAMYVESPDSTASDNRVASTAWVQSIVADALKSAKAEIYKQAKLDAHPVGSYYWSNDSTSPATLFGGTWEALPAGYTLIAQGSGTDNYGSFTYTVGQKYGERKHQLTTEEIASHGHMVRTWNTAASGAPQLYRDGKWERYTQGAFKVSGEWKDDAGTTANSPQGGLGDPAGTTDGTGGNAAHNNIQPSIAAYCWRRTA